MLNIPKYTYIIIYKIVDDLEKNCSTFLFSPWDMIIEIEFPLVSGQFFFLVSVPLLYRRIDFSWIRACVYSSCDLDKPVRERTKFPARIFLEQVFRQTRFKKEEDSCMFLSTNADYRELRIHSSTQRDKYVPLFLCLSIVAR